MLNQSFSSQFSRVHYFLFITVFYSNSIVALPECPATGVLDNCSASVILDGGSKYIGDFVDGIYEGRGAYTYADGEGYVGEFENGKFEGAGIYTYANGDKYVGDFKAGKKSGRGVYTRADGSIEKGVFSDDKLIYESKIANVN